MLDTATQPIWVVDPSDVIRGALLHSLAGNHPLVDGNKRLAWLATCVFLAKNGVDPGIEPTSARQLTGRCRIETARRFRADRLAEVRA